MSSKYEVIYPYNISRLLYESANRVEFFKSDYFKETLEELIYKIEMQNTMPIVSCDIFDTVLLRNNKSEPFRFYEIANAIKKRLSLKQSAYEILQARYLGTEISYAASPIVAGCREGSLYDIHTVMMNTLSLNKSMINESIIAELEYEKENLELNTGLWNFLKDLKNQNRIKIIFISDMYQHVTHIENLISFFIAEHVDYIDKIYSSADETISKHSSLLFKYVQEDMGVRPEYFLHMGDNLRSDFNSAKKRGWNALFLPVPKYHQEQIRDNLISFKETLDKDNINIKLVNRLFTGS